MGMCRGPGPPSCVYVVVNRQLWKAMPMQRSKKLFKKKKEEEDEEEDDKVKKK